MVSGLYLAVSAALAVLLTSTLLVYRAFPQRYLLVWSAGWLLYLAHMNVMSRAVSAQSWTAAALLLAAQALVAGAAGSAAGKRAALRRTLPIAAAALGASWFAAAIAPNLRNLPLAAGYFLLGAAGAWWLVQYASQRAGVGSYVLACALIARVVYLPHLFDEPVPAAIIVEAATALLALLAMLTFALDSMRHHLRWSAAPGIIATMAADYAVPGRLTADGLERIASEIRRTFDAAFSRLYLQPAREASNADAAYLLPILPRSPSGETSVPAVLGPERGPEAAAWLTERNLRWAVIVPISAPRHATSSPAGIFVLGYRSRRSLSPEMMEALLVTGRQFGILVENSILLQQLSAAYRDWLNTVDAIGDLILVHDPEYRIKRANRAVSDRVGVPPAELVQRLCADVLPRAAGGMWKDCPFCENPGRGDTYDEQLRGYFLVSTYRYTHDEEHEIQHVVRDISERKRAEEKYRTLFEKVHEGVFVSSREGRFLDCNDALTRMMGYDREELLALDISRTFVSPADRQRYLELMDTQGFVREYEVRLLRKNGEQLIGLETSFGMRDESGRVVQFQGFLLDITARKLAEKELARHVVLLSQVNQLAERLAESLDTRELLATATADLKRMFGADSAAAYLIDTATGEASVVALEGQEILAAAAPFSLSVTREFIEAAQRERRAVVRLRELPPLPREFDRFRGADWLRSTFLLPLHAEGVLAGITITWRAERDLTEAEESLMAAVSRQLSAALQNARLFEATRKAYDELRRAQEQLLQSEKMAALGQLVSGVAHELNNPLTAIMGYSQLLSVHVTGKGGEYLQKLLRQAQRTQRIIQNLLSFSRQYKPERRVLDLNRVVEETLVLRDLDMQSGNVLLERTLCSGLPPVVGDVHQLEQVFLNIINNACDALKESAGGGRLAVRTYVDNGSVIAEFADNGPGMREPARVFDPFYTTKAVGKGTGLGLSICYGIVKEHGGEISAENRAEGGAAFRVRLPVAESAAASATAATA